MAQVNDPHEVFQARLERFKFVIKKYKMDQLKIVNDKASKQEEYELDKINNDARNKNADTFKKLEDSVKVAEKIFKSRKLNQCRMLQMKVRFDMVQKIQQAAKKELNNQKNDVKKYKALLKELIKQGLIKLLQEKVEIRCLKSDENVVREVMVICQKEFNEDCQVQTNIVINTNNHLEASDLGGVILTSFRGRIVCDNTLRARLSYCMQLLLPNIRGMLFQASDQYLHQKRKQKKPEVKKTH